jgi:hypothetical protein
VKKETQEFLFGKRNTRNTRNTRNIKETQEFHFLKRNTTFSLQKKKHKFFFERKETQEFLKKHNKHKKFKELQKKHKIFSLCKIDSHLKTNFCFVFLIHFTLLSLPLQQTIENFSTFLT